MVAVEQGAWHTLSLTTQSSGLKGKSDISQIIIQIVNYTDDKCNRGEVWWTMRAHSHGIWRGDLYPGIQRMRTSWPSDRVHEVPPIQKKHQPWMSRRSLLWLRSQRWPMWLDQWGWVGEGQARVVAQNTAPAADKDRLIQNLSLALRYWF